MQVVPPTDFSPTFSEAKSVWICILIHDGWLCTAAAAELQHRGIQMLLVSISMDGVRWEFEV